VTLVDPKAGGWALGEKLTSAQMDTVRDGILAAVDGSGGGSYSLGANLTFGGTGEVRIDNVLRVLTGADFFLDAGASASFNGDVDYTGDLTFDAAGTSTYDIGHTVTYGSINDLLVDDQDILFRLDMTSPHVVDAGGPSWTSTGTSAWIQTVLSASAIINIPVRVLAGDVIESIGITLDGAAGHGGVLPSTMPRIRLMEQASLDGSWASVFSYDDPSPDAATYEGQHTFVIDAAALGGTLPYTALNRLYRLEIRGENGGSAVTGLTLGAVTAVVHRNQLVSTNIL
jgi:hypothetical protein